MFNRLIKLSLVVVVFILLIMINANIMPRINNLRESAGLTRNLPLENAPPQYVLAVNLLGGFRCILVDVLWLRTMKLREENKYFEMAQLYKWICQLEPQIEEVWVHSAWNMAYNVSFEMPYAEDRWRWIKKSIQLLRDEGLKFNTRSARIMREIAWIYSHKVGQYWDDKHWYYKKQFAQEMGRLIKSSDDIEKMSKLNKMKDELDKDENLQAVWNELKAKGIRNHNDFYKRYKKLHEINNYDINTLNQIDFLLRADELKKTYQLDLNMMVEIMDRFGSMDWRLPDPHAIYWAYNGLQYAPEKYSIFYDRIIYISMQNLFRRGNLSLNYENGELMYLTIPEKHFIEPMNELYSELLEKYEGHVGRKNIVSSYKYFLKEAIVLLHSLNEKDNSEYYFEILLDKFPEIAKERDYPTFVTEQFKAIVKEGYYDQVKSLIYSLTRQAYWNLASGDDEQYDQYLELAVVLWTEYSNSIRNQERLKLPSMDIFKKQVIENALNNDFPKDLRSALIKKLNAN